MPNRDHNGPQSKGPQTGRGMGTCGRTAVQPGDLIQEEHTNNGRGTGRGRRRRHGQGNGRCGRHLTLDLTPQDGRVHLLNAPVAPATQEPSVDETRVDLERQIRWLKEQLDVLEARLDRERIA